MRVLLRPAAAADIEDAHHWYRGHDEGLGDEFLAAVRLAIQRLQEQPTAYPVLHRDTRRIRLRRFPYGLFYRIYPDRILVVACMHGRRDPRVWKARA